MSFSSLSSATIRVIRRSAVMGLLLTMQMQATPALGGPPPRRMMPPPMPPHLMMNQAMSAKAMPVMMGQHTTPIMNQGMTVHVMPTMTAPQSTPTNVGLGTFPGSTLFGPVGPYGGLFSPLGMINPYAGSLGYGGSGYGGGYGGASGGGGGGYGGGRSGGGGYGSGGSGGGGSSSGNKSPMADSAYQPLQPGQAAGTSPNWLDSLGLPNERGRLSWPLGLRVLAPAQEVQELRQRIDGSFQRAANQTGSSSVAPAVLEGIDSGVARLRALLRANGDGLAEATQNDARRFLAQLSRAAKELR